MLVDDEPKFIYFDEKARTLSSEYSLDEIIHSASGSAITNLVELANFSPIEFKRAIEQENSTKVEELLEEANIKIEHEFDAWSQSSVFPKIARHTKDSSKLCVHIKNPNVTRNYTSTIDSGSDGIRQFISLFIFIKMNQHKPQDILLIDEAETHLHYDAQADLIREFTKQTFTQKVIYTTHSLGCLPEDLGNGIRFIERVEKLNRSKIKNWFWDQPDHHGFSSILFGMGATTMTFIPLQNVVFGEGAVDHILLPTLLREATGHKYLGFQIAPGISNSSPEQIKIIEKEAPKTLFITDSDHGEKSLHKNLKHAGIPVTRINSLSGSNRNTGVAIEELIDKNAYLDAVQKELLQQNDITLKDLNSLKIPKCRRAYAVDRWCIKNKISKPSKRNVAFRLLELKQDDRLLLANEHKLRMKALYKWIEKFFE